MTDPAEYCRAIETYLCRKNEGHLIRIVGPVFEQVSGWATQGVPLAVAYRGIDRYCERYYAKGQRRRPVRVEFCEGDVLSMFDDWRRAVGVANPAADADDVARQPADTLPSHVDRVLARLTAMRASVTPAYSAQIEGVVRELDAARPAARHARGEARAALLSRLAELDRALLQSARGEIDAARGAVLSSEAAADIAPFAARMSADARARATEAAFDRLLREALGLPTLVHEP